MIIIISKPELCIVDDSDVSAFSSSDVGISLLTSDGRSGDLELNSLTSPFLSNSFLFDSNTSVALSGPESSVLSSTVDNESTPSLIPNFPESDFVSQTDQLLEDIFLLLVSCKEYPRSPFSFISDNLSIRDDLNFCHEAVSLRTMAGVPGWWRSPWSTEIQSSIAFILSSVSLSILLSPGNRSKFTKLISI